jgi:hypothetical protein
MLTSLEPPSPASSAGPCEVERSLQTTPQLPGPLPVTSPPESYPAKPRDAAESPRVTPVSKRWFRTRFKKINKSQASQPPDRLSTKSGHPVKPGFDSQSQPTASIAQNRPSRYAAGQRQAVSISSSVDNRCVVCLTKYFSDRSENPSIGFVVQFIRWRRCLSILRDSVRQIPRLLNRGFRSRTRPVVDKGLQVQRKWVPCISFQ